jgi:hypothetical protein
VPPAPVRPARRALERGRRNPRKGYGHLPHTNAGRRRDVRPANASPPSPLAMFGHPRRCATIPSPVRPSRAPREPGETRRCHARGCAPHGLPSAVPSSQRTGDDRTRSSHITALEAAPGREQDTPQRPTGARVARTAINSVALYGISPHVIRIARRDSKSPPGL